MKDKKNHLLLPFLLNLGFTIIEFVGGLLTNSIALISDSIHDAGDSMSIGLSLFLQKKSEKKATGNHTYGYARYSVLGGFVSSVVLLLGSGIVLYESIPRLIHPETVQSKELIYFAVFGVAVNLFAALRAKKGSSINEKVISLHLLEDALGWIALLFGAIMMQIFSWYRIDSILSIAFTLFILFNVFKNIREIIHIFMEVAPKSPTQDEIIHTLEAFDVVKNVHHIHLWTMEGSIVLATMHVLLNEDISQDEYVDVQEHVHHKLKELGIAHATVEFEFPDSHCEDQDCEELMVPMADHHHHHHHH